jgi:hypothetical protein
MLIITCHNDGTGTEEWGNYDCEVRVNERVIAKARVEKHYRPSSWRILVARIAAEAKDA